MTMRSVGKSQEVWTPTAGFHVAAIAEESQAQALKAVEDASDEYWAEWWAKCDDLMLLMYPKPPPRERLRIYQNKPTQEAPPVPPMQGVDGKGEPVLVAQPQPPPTGSWYGQKTQFPLDYVSDMEDWVRLEPISVRRDQVLRELALIEALATGQMAMNAPAELGLPPPTSGVAEDLPALQWEGVE